jgi:sterol 14-demethylase
VLACDELADNPAAISQLRQLFDRLDHSTTPLAILLPWFPSPALLRKYFATKKIFSIISDAVRIRENGGMVKRVDTLQILMELGESRTLVVGVSFQTLLSVAMAEAKLHP